MKMQIGFYGPGRGMTQAQRQTLFLFLQPMGGDAVAHVDGTATAGAAGTRDTAASDFLKMARSLGWGAVLHPYTGTPVGGVIFDHIEPPLPPGPCRRRLVDESMMLVCTPAGDEEDGEDATWDVIRMANEKGRPLVVIWPDGGVRMERMG